MSVDLVATDWARKQFGDDAPEVMRRVVWAIRTAHQSALDAQHASGLEKNYAYGSVWSAKYRNLVAELSDMPGAEIVKVPNTGYYLVKLRGKLLVPFLHAPTLSVPITQAKIGNALRDLTDLLVPRPPRVPDLFDWPDMAESAVLDEQTADPDASTEPDPDPTVIYIGYVANADSPSVLGAWWGLGQAQAADGALTWSPEPLPLRIVGPGERPTRIPPLRAEDQISAFDQGPVPPVRVTARPRPLDAPATDDEHHDGPAGADDRE